MNFVQTTRPVHAAPYKSFFRRTLALFVCWLLILQPTLASATSALTQRPQFTVAAFPPNVTLIMDDSSSMREYRLPVPDGLPDYSTSVARANVLYGTGVKSVSLANEISLRAPAFNPIWYNPATTYTPWIDDDKPAPNVGVSYPANGFTYPNADFGGSGTVANVALLTQRDMRGRTPGSRNYVTAARGTVGQGVNPADGMPWYDPASTPALRMTWNAVASPARWEWPLTSPSGLALYPPMPGEGPQGADLFTNPSPQTCTSGPPCLVYNQQLTNTTCRTYNQIQVNDQCLSYDQVPVNDYCLVYDQMQVQTTCQIYNQMGSGPCITYAYDAPVYGACDVYNQVQQQTTCRTYNYLPGGVCLAYDPDVHTPTNICNDVPDPTSETGFRQECSIQDVVTQGACNTWSAPIQDTCAVWNYINVNGTCAHYPIDHYDPGTCTAYQSYVDNLNSCQTYNYTNVDNLNSCHTWHQSIGNGACNSWSQRTVDGTMCLVWNQTLQNTTCQTLDPNWTCPVYTSNTDQMTPARYLRYEGPTSNQTLADRSNPGNYRIIEIDRATSQNYPVIDAVSGLAGSRDDCAAHTTCTFAEEAQNFANWYTYYRNRLFAAMGVMSGVLKDLQPPQDELRIGYGRINYFPNGPKTWDVTNLSNREPIITDNQWKIDGTAGNGTLVRGVRPFLVGTPDRANVFEWLFTLNWIGSTPNREALYNVGTYYSRNDNFSPYALNPAVGENPNQNLWCRQNYSLLATDGEWTRVNPTALAANQKPQPYITGTDYAADPRPNNGTTSTVLNSLAVQGPPLTGSNPSTGASRSYQYLPATETWISGGSGTTTATLSDVAMYFWSHDLRPEVYMKNSFAGSTTDRAFWQHMSNYIVGYGVTATQESDARAAFAAQTSMSWGVVGDENCRIVDVNNAPENLPGSCNTLLTQPYGNRINDTLRAGLLSGGDFYSAASVDQLRSSLKSAFQQIANSAASGTAVSLSSNTIASGNLIIQSTFLTDSWEGFVRAYDSVELLAWLGGGTQPTPKWEASTPTTRNLLTSTAKTTPRAFTWPNLTVAQKGQVDGLTSTLATNSPVMQWLQGDASREQRNGGVYRNRRTSKFGDIVNSTPLYSGATDYSYAQAPAASFSASGPNGADSYNRNTGGYLASKAANRTPLSIFGSNDGMLHALDARVGQGTSGQELFGYVPRSVYANLNPLSNPAYVHHYTVDGPVVEGDVWNSTSHLWKTIVIGTAGAGGQGLFAIDVTSPQSGITTSNVMWDTLPADFGGSSNLIGNMLYPGVIGSVHYDADNNATTLPNGKWVYIIGNGYESTSNDAALLIIDAFDGSLIKAIATNTGSVGTPNGLGAVMPVYDGNRNVIYVYAGDKLGNLWKFDLRSSDKSNWAIFNQVSSTPAPLFTATDSSSNRQPISAAPRITLHPEGGLYVVFGTGKFFENGDNSDTNEQAIYALWDRSTLPTIAKSALQQLTLQEITVSNNTFRKIKASDLASFNFTDQGFYMPLNPEGVTDSAERVIATPVLDAGSVSITSFTPVSAGDLCIAGGVSFLYRFDLQGTFTQPNFTGQNGAVVGARLNPGSIGALAPVYTPAVTSGTVVTSMSQADITGMMNTPKYKVVGGQAIQQDAGGSCAHVGLQINGTIAEVPTLCSGVLPIRTWRPMR